MKKYELISHTADLGIAGCGETLAEAFCNIALGMFEQMADVGTVSPVVCKEVNVSADDQESLLVDWLNDLLYLVDTEGMVFARSEIDALTETGLRSRNYGEKIAPGRHHLKMGIKAATYHQVTIERRGSQYRVQVIFDV